MARPATFWLTDSSRFASIPRSRARIALGLLALLLALCLTALAAPDPQALGAAERGGSGQTDLMLYEKIVSGVRGGENYYVVAADALRAGSYPLRPFLTFRLPGLASALAAVPQWLPVRYFLFTLVLCVAGAWANRLRDDLKGPLPAVAALVLMLGSLLVFAQFELAPFHEIWAALLVALSLAIRRPGRWIEAVAIGLAAMLIRETAAIYVFIMLGFAWLEGERREAIGWGAALALFVVAMGAHAWAVAGVTGPTDPLSPGWAGLLGFGFFVKAVTLATGLQMLPLWAGALLVGLSLFGWAAWREPAGLRMVAVLAGYAALIGIFARLDTFYWALMVAPVFLLGLLFAPAGIRDLVRQSLDKPRITVTRVTR
ncbi:MAG: hypothetical protein KF730_11820 [Sphingomonas sp.]|uniref:hypothetical protein n=1 Tax=Sphingomonas sp. TaxID=28214 RepID=UPI0025D39F60|nr:hypothetical protein [Sphingomonas sp.]MBX3565247.1 hypothetical protein [Sphingomonas sp.]